MSLAFAGTTGEGEAGGRFTTFTFGVPLMPTLPDTGCVAGKLPTFTVPLTVWVDGKLLTETGGRLLTPTLPVTACVAGKLLTLTAPLTGCVAGKFPTLTVPDTACVAGKLLTDTLPGFTPKRMVLVSSTTWAFTVAESGAATNADAPTSTAANARTPHSLTYFIHTPPFSLEGEGGGLDGLPPPSLPRLDL